MRYVIWRLHRSHVLVVTVGLTALATLLATTGVNMASTNNTAVSSCGATHSCDELPTILFQNDGALVDLDAGTMILPALLGVLWAPLIAGELESGTKDLIWTQSITRRRWTVTNIGWAVAIAIL